MVNLLKSAKIQNGKRLFKNSRLTLSYRGQDNLYSQFANKFIVLTLVTFYIFYKVNNALAILVVNFITLLVGF